MITLRQALAESSPTLIVDCASARIQTGLWSTSHPGEGRWETAEGEAGTCLFGCVDRLLSRAGCRLEAIRSIVYCEGPGSVLGIRTSAVALRAWSVLAPRRLLSFRSLELVAAQPATAGRPVIADARRGTWHVCHGPGSVERVPADQLPPPPLVAPAGFRSWAAEPPGLERLAYDLETLWLTAVDLPLLREAPSPDAFQHEDPSYVRWTPRIHEAPERAP